MSGTSQVLLGLEGKNTTTTSKLTSLQIGNNKADGTTGSSHGTIILYGKGTNYTHLKAYDSTSNRDISFPDKSGTVLLDTNIFNNTLPASIIQIIGGNTTSGIDNFTDIFSNYRNSIFCFYTTQNALSVAFIVYYNGTSVSTTVIQGSQTLAATLSGKNLSINIGDWGRGYAIGTTK